MPDMLMVEKCWSNDDVEHFFSEIVRRCTFKPNARTVEGVCGTIEALRIVRSDPKKAFWAWVSKKKKYADEDWATELKVWNNGSSIV
jgi:hypothetical protein